MKSLLFCLLFFGLAAIAAAQAPWLPSKDQAALRELIPKGVPFGDGARAYRLPQRYQSIYFLNGHEQRDINPVKNQPDPWKVSGGMHFAARKDWRNITALELPAGATIAVWEQYVDAGAPGPVKKWRWIFPEGTLAYDILVRTGNGPERIFEVRVHERLKSGWDHGTTYRPSVEIPEGEPKRHEWQFVAELVDGRRTIAAKAAWRSVPALNPDAPFVPRKSLVTDRGGLTPLNYVGTGTNCTACHQHAGKRTGYGEALRGDDGRFSWHPFTNSGQIDRRWPVRMAKK